MAGGTRLKHILPLSEVRCNGSRNSMQGALTLCHVSLQNCLNGLFYVCSGRIEMARLKVHISCTGMALCVIFILSGWPRSSEGFCGSPPSTLLEWAQSLWHAVAALEVPPLAPTCFVERFESVVSRLEPFQHYSAQDWCLCYIGLRNVEHKSFWKHDQYGRMPDLTWMKNLPADKRNIMKLTILNNTAANLQAAKVRGPAIGSAQLSAMLMGPIMQPPSVHNPHFVFNQPQLATTPSRAPCQLTLMEQQLSSGRRRARDAPLRTTTEEDGFGAPMGSMRPQVPSHGSLALMDGPLLDTVVEEHEESGEENSEDLETLRNLQHEITQRFLKKQQKYNRGIRKKRSAGFHPVLMNHSVDGLLGLKEQNAGSVGFGEKKRGFGGLKEKNPGFVTPSSKRTNFTPTNYNGATGSNLNSMSGCSLNAMSGINAGTNLPTRRDFDVHEETDSEIDESDLVGAAPVDSQMPTMLVGIASSAAAGSQQLASTEKVETNAYAVDELEEEDADLRAKQSDISNTGATLGKAAGPNFNRAPKFNLSASSVPEKTGTLKKLAKISKKSVIDVAGDPKGNATAARHGGRKSSNPTSLKAIPKTRSGGRAQSSNSMNFTMSPIVAPNPGEAKMDIDVIAEASATALEAALETADQSESEDDLLADKATKIRRQG